MSNFIYLTFNSITKGEYETFGSVQHAKKLG